MAPELRKEPGGDIDLDALDVVTQTTMGGSPDFMRFQDGGDIAAAGLGASEPGHILPLLVASVRQADFRRDKDFQKVNATIHSSNKENDKKETRLKGEITGLKIEVKRLDGEVTRLKGEVEALKGVSGEVAALKGLIGQLLREKPDMSGVSSIPHAFPARWVDPSNCRERYG